MNTAYESGDVTILVIVNKETDLIAFATSMDSWSSCRPHEIIVSTTSTLFSKVSTICSTSSAQTRITKVEKADIPLQLVELFNTVVTPIVAITDSNSIWKPNFLKFMTAPFGRSDVKAVCTSIESRHSGSLSSTLADMVLTVYSSDLAACSTFEGGIDSLPGSSSLFKSNVVQDTVMQCSMKSENYIEELRDVEEFMWDWISGRGMCIAYQNHSETRLSRSFDSFSDVMNLIWQQSLKTFRYDTRGLVKTRFVWRQFPWLAARMILRLLRPFIILYSIALFVYLMTSVPTWSWKLAVVLNSVWIMAGSLLTMLTAWDNSPSKIIFYPLFLVVDITTLFVDTGVVLSQLIALPFQAVGRVQGPAADETLATYSSNLTGIVTQKESHLHSIGFGSATNTDEARWKLDSNTAMTEMLPHPAMPELSTNSSSDMQVCLESPSLSSSDIKVLWKSQLPAPAFPEIPIKASMGRPRSSLPPLPSARTA